MNNIFKKEKGFTLLEMLISIMIITIGIFGTYSAVLKYTKATQQARENLTAVYLCQEGIEIIKNIRDSNWISAVSWDTGLTACNSGCEIDYEKKGGDGTTNGLTTWSSPGNFLYIDETTGLYKYEHTSADIETPWTRKITIDNGTTDILKITVLVTWGSNNMIVKEDIYNWK
ncbi:prepilin-type N-terminal cleavage/methylation domain-containing protein [bacterium]|jgi:prepilin-type N-terminal cleavage/methylation domain-containing protein|nr:prepilin-type N-terminal cleavage/methylation domain-containing protein [bacterium]